MVKKMLKRTALDKSSSFVKPQPPRGFALINPRRLGVPLIRWVTPYLQREKLLTGSIPRIIAKRLFTRKPVPVPIRGDPVRSGGVNRNWGDGVKSSLSGVSEIH
jgi:hypothetical protein